MNAPNAPSERPNVLLVPDGTRRWARLHNRSEEESYQLGTQRVVEIAHRLAESGFNEFWVFLFRPVNFGRNQATVKAIMDACLSIHEVAEASAVPINVSLAGRLNFLPPEYQQRFQALESHRTDSDFTTNIIIGWSTDEEIKSLTFDPSHNRVTDVQPFLYRVSPIEKHIDLAIRTGMTQGTGRLSGVLPLHSLDAEISFSPKLFPDYVPDDMSNALEAYANRYPRDI